MARGKPQQSLTRRCLGACSLLQLREIPQERGKQQELVSLANITAALCRKQAQELLLWLLIWKSEPRLAVVRRAPAELHAEGLRMRNKTNICVCLFVLQEEK